MSGLLSCAFIPFILTAWSAAAEDTAAALSALGSDDECQAGNAERCGLNAVQLRRQSVSLAGPNNGGLAGPWQQCGGKGFEGPFGCEGEYTCFTVSEHYSQCKPLTMQCGGINHKGATECPDGFICFNMTEHYSVCKQEADVDLVFEEYKGSDLLNNASEAKVLTFYMYRVVNAGDYPPKNANLGSIGAIMYYIHSMVAACKKGCEKVRTDGLERVARYKVMTKATEPLFLAGLNFHGSHNFQDGQCTAEECDETFAKYGYSVGCKNLSAGPDFYYSGAFYSLPAECPAKKRNLKSMECKKGQPGGLCKGVPTGTGTCTWSYEEAGVVSIDELEGIATNYTAFREEGGEEYDQQLDKGTHMSFWDGRGDAAANTARVEKLDALFKKKYPDMPGDKQLPIWPLCDFDKKALSKN